MRTLAAILLLSLLPGAAQAQAMCGVRLVMIDTLKKQFDETPRAMAISAHSVLVEFFVSKKGTWTMLTTTPNGQSCILAAGNSWEEILPKPEGKDT